MSMVCLCQVWRVHLILNIVHLCGWRLSLQIRGIVGVHIGYELCPVAQSVTERGQPRVTSVLSRV